MTWCLLGLQKWPQEDESLNHLMRFYPVFGSTFAEVVWKTGIRELQEVDPLASSAALTGTFLQQSASSQP